MESELLKGLAPILITVVTALASWGLAEVSKYVRSKTKNENALKALDDVSLLVRTSVAEVGQTFITAAGDGKITVEEGRAMKNQVILKVKKQVPSLVEKHAKLAVNDLDDFIAARIEREVVKTKV